MVISCPSEREKTSGCRGLESSPAAPHEQGILAHDLLGTACSLPGELWSSAPYQVPHPEAIVASKSFLRHHCYMPCVVTKGPGLGCSPWDSASFQFHPPLKS